MACFKSANESILVACETGDIETLKTLFRDLDIGPGQPKNSWDFDKTLVADHTIPVLSMIYSAIQGNQIDTIVFLASAFPNTMLGGGPLDSAIKTMNPALVRTVCNLDPKGVNLDYSHMNPLGVACSLPCHPKKEQVVKVLLENGADPNKPGPHVPPYTDISHAIASGMPLSTIEDFFDAGFECNDWWSIRRAVSTKRHDVAELLFSRGKKIPTASYPPKDELIKDAIENNDIQMVEIIKNLYPKTKKRGVLGTIVGVVRS